MVDQEKHVAKLKGIFGNPTAEIVLLHIHELQESWARMIADDYDVAVTPIGVQLERFEALGVLIKRVRGRTIIYSFNDASPYTPHLKALISTLSNSLTTHQRTVFATRRQQLAPQRGTRSNQNEPN